MKVGLDWYQGEHAKLWGALRRPLAQDCGVTRDWPERPMPVAEGVLQGVVEHVDPDREGTTAPAGARVRAASSVSWWRSSRLPTRRVRLRTGLACVLVDVGNTSSRKTATLPNGINAASLDVRYSSSGAVALRAVGRVETVIACNVLNKMTATGRPNSYAISR